MYYIIYIIILITRFFLHLITFLYNKKEQL